MKASLLALVLFPLGLGLGFAAGALFHSDSTGGSSTGALPTTLAADRSDAKFAGRSAGNETLSSLDGQMPQASTSSAPISRAATASPEARRLARQSIEIASSASREGSSDDPDDWTHSIRGTVIDQDGQPLPGVQIVSLNRVGNGWRGAITGANTAKIGRAWGGVADVETKAAENAERLLEDARNHRTAMSDAAGRFTLTGLREGLHSVGAHAEGYAFAPQSTHTAQECAFIGERVLEMELDVRLPDGSQPPSAVVFMGERQFGSGVAWTPEEPRLRVKEAAFELTVRSGSVQRIDWRNTASDFSSDPQPINLHAMGPGPHVVQLSMNQILRVALKDASELVPKLPVWMKVASVTVEAGTSSDEIDWTEERHSSLTLASSGSFQVMNLPKGSYWLAAGRGVAGSDPEATLRIELKEGVTEETISLEEVDLTRFVTCHCVRSEGGPVAGVSFEVGDQRSRGYRSTRIQSISRGRGVYWLPKRELFPEESEDSSSEGVELLAKSEIDGQVHHLFEPGTDEVTVEFLPVCSVQLEIAGDVSAGFTAHASPLNASGKATVPYISSRTPGVKKVAEDGAVAFKGLQPGDYEIEIYETGHSSEGMSFIRRDSRVMFEPIELRRPETTVRMTLPTFQKVVVHAPDVAAGGTFYLARAGGNRFGGGVSAKVDKNSMAVFDRIASGEYTLRGPQRNTPMEISVPSGDIQWVAEVVDAALVRSVEAEGPAFLAGFKKGDIVVALDGVPVKGRLAARTLMKKIAEQSVRFTVLRKGDSIDLTLGPLASSDGKSRSPGMSTAPHTLKTGSR